MPAGLQGWFQSPRGEVIDLDDETPEPKRQRIEVHVDEVDAAAATPANKVETEDLDGGSSEDTIPTPGPTPPDARTGSIVGTPGPTPGSSAAGSPPARQAATSKVPSSSPAQPKSAATDPSLPDAPGPQTLSQPPKETQPHMVVNSPYGPRRAALGWGSVFQSGIQAVPDDARVRVGTSSLNCVPGGSGRSGFAGAVAAYARKFKALEHCAPYHRMASPEVWGQWRGAAEKAAKGFKMSVKMGKFVTHERSLQCSAPDVADYAFEFLSRCRLLGGSLACVLIQLPPSMSFRPSLEADLEALAGLLRREAAAAGKSEIPLVFEMRSRSMRCPAVFDLLRRHGWATVVSDIPPQNLEYVETSSTLAYFRLHGSLGQFVGDYGPSACRKYAAVAKRLAGEGKEVYVFFNNNESSAGGVASSVADATYFARQL
eukprot:Hpha_TRINITY_DN16410_c2_g2::TRINITY_DN16410_c2_g2_i1::g.162595::m.162595